MGSIRRLNASRNVRRRRIAYAGLAILLATGVGYARMDSAVAAATEQVAAATETAGDFCTKTTPRPAYCHFIRISSRGAPDWSADVTLWDSTREKEIYTWHEHHLGSDHGPLWWWIAGSAGGSLDVYLNGRTGLPGGSTVDDKKMSIYDSYCYHVNPFGYVSSKGKSSNTDDHCTPA